MEPRTWQIHIHPRIEQNYAEFAGQTLLLPAGIEPSEQAVQRRYKQFPQSLSSRFAHLETDLGTKKAARDNGD